MLLQIAGTEGGSGSGDLSGFSLQNLPKPALLYSPFVG
jgi:hypothetical protein